MTNSIIQINDLNYRYEEAADNALKNITVDIEQNSWTAIVGQNGSGKSTLTKLLNGILQTNEGKIVVNGMELTDETVWDIRKVIGIVFQNPDNQFVGATVEDDVAFGLENQGIAQSEMKERVISALKKVRMEEFATRDPQSLSGGQKQRVAIAGVIALEPKIIILDEATSMLDPSGRREIIQIIQGLRKELDLTVISITHDVEEVTLASDVLVLSKGVILKKDSPEKIFTDKDLLIKAGLQLPFVQDVQQQLIAKGVSIPDTWHDEEGLIEEIWKSHLNK
ncbi:energy-coupling factor transporter ATP-binding protein EcfA1 [Companilactobacillus sp. RD055328]|uniref:energy-coupling factor transporter ATPase n=1 Tax=Companilactobacillus sp. RD055328 TaxID=2916634 RepID=UPI001FC8D03B|nr:energy-coupling factor transporter ATPase [Companilactobacillus sp. RD055328]GKQ42235.1 energy-coupling factor transporter ATP-binding protein EcfA1 [Companilactobacillus sp. RD055328]